MPGRRQFGDNPCYEVVGFMGDGYGSLLQGIVHLREFVVLEFCKAVKMDKRK